jgi:hypothetical protein
MFICMTLLAAVIVISGKLVEVTRNYGNYDEVSAKLASVQGIYDVRIDTIAQGFFSMATDVEMISFRLLDKPNSSISIVSPTPDLFVNTQTLCLAIISDLALGVTFRDSNGNFLGSGAPDIGAAGPLQDQLPLTPSDLDDLVSHYELFEAYFKQWPVYPNVGTLKVSPTEYIEFYQYPPQ